MVAPFSQIGRFAAIFGAVTMVFTGAVASVYPALSLWFLTRGPSRAACLKELPSTEPPNAKEAGEAW